MATIIENIESGKYDKSLDRIMEACRERKENRIYSLKPGDKVKFSSSTRPTYLRGTTATIVEWRRSRVLVKLDDGQFIGKFSRWGGKLIAHAASLIPVEKA